MTSSTHGALRLYKSYSFTDKDPIIDRLRTIIRDEKIEHSDLADQSGVSLQTLYNWFHGETKRPQFATVAAVVRSMGYELEVVRGKKVVQLAPFRQRAVSTVARKRSAA